MGIGEVGEKRRETKITLRNDDRANDIRDLIRCLIEVTNAIAEERLHQRRSRFKHKAPNTYSGRLNTLDLSGDQCRSQNSQESSSPKSDAYYPCRS